MKRTSTLGYLSLLLLAFALLTAEDCGNESKADLAQREATDNLTAQAQQQVGMPGVSLFTERRIVAKLYAMRDQSLATHTYVMDMTGKLWFVCDSLGFGLPYGVQFTNPERPVWGGHGDVAIPQPEPNGLFMPATAEGTWVICAGEKAGDFLPMYVEPRVVVSPFKLKSAGSWQE